MMAWCQILKFPGSTVAQYDAIAKAMGLTADPATWPKACLSHVAGVTPDGRRPVCRRRVGVGG